MFEKKLSATDKKFKDAPPPPFQTSLAQAPIQNQQKPNKTYSKTVKIPLKKMFQNHHINHFKKQNLKTIPHPPNKNHFKTTPLPSTFPTFPTQASVQWDVSRHRRRFDAQQRQRQIHGLCCRLAAVALEQRFFAFFFGFPIVLKRTIFVLGFRRPFCFFQKTSYFCFCFFLDGCFWIGRFSRAHGSWLPSDKVQNTSKKNLNDFLRRYLY